MSRAILITGATGKQGGAVISALLARQPSDFLLLAVTRNAQSTSAKRLAAKSSNIKLVEGDLDATPALFASAKAVAGTVPLWGVYSVQAMGDQKSDSETKQGKALVDESIKAGVRHFVYSSVERGGDERSWSNPTPVPHFITKHQIEHHLRDSAVNSKTDMGWTILRPVIFMDNLMPGFFGKVFFTMLRDTMKEKPLQWIATKDIGFFAAEAFHDPATWNKKAVGLAGDELTFSQMNQTFEKATGAPVGTTFGLLGKALKHGVSEIGIMVNWFKDEGYKANLSQVKKVHPDILTMGAWLKESAFVKK
ncbi:nucleoside-diphosphate-sugar epimerase family protein [Colletotrichum paranaense]|uniref:Nucleoside-diphosphate-sugar epimerase family protein n=3 Tax=Colletotrichum acutatum species complex TaxID=2707335 RepID=A0A9Q0B1U6_9PEZI|nr:nucleoside-diphosphate-sugar epimerase family protein [Colletotrichum lupini]XP_060350483.1 nucleoside-diphosphate-sugar epimerase family protein [Colletotrichum paranaense]XP_060405525.1 nucleoside-diphosphate-sugar epimerase family protein [Colletotrichum abscissum]KAI3541234.1 nucleoside-diphosphate-sugar epimerase family protein [Colletotrichum abscissum]KAK1523362.1 nucleoside-diphosphate-sugar epimerase family protein [Colletotrichum abscissum]KAK1541351.1 nucleoside-diphosphate-sugar